jgi:LuxR family transcriptional regulator, quorum-sensing system regulator SolR
MLTLARSSEALEPDELAHGEMKMRWLAHIAHLILSRIFTTRQAEEMQPHLTAREIEVLKWTADGKTSADISSLLDVSENTVNFHVKNAVTKLQTTNKTAATVRAAMLGLLG